MLAHRPPMWETLLAQTPEPSTSWLKWCLGGFPIPLRGQRHSRQKLHGWDLGKAYRHSLVACPATCRKSLLTHRGSVFVVSLWFLVVGSWGFHLVLLCPEVK